MAGSQAADTVVAEREVGRGMEDVYNEGVMQRNVGPVTIATLILLLVGAYSIGGVTSGEGDISSLFIILTILVLSYLIFVFAVAIKRHDIKQHTRTKQALEKVQQQSEFVSLVAGKFQDPISSLKRNLQMLSKGDAGRPTKKMKAVFHDLQEVTEGMSQLVEDLFKISHFDEGRIEINAELHDVAKLVKSVVDRMALKAQKKSVSLKLECQEGASVLVDPKFFKEVVRNLVDNAVKYSPADNNVCVRVRKEDGQVVISVEDHGIGIPAEEQERVFERFFRASNADKACLEGTGLGLNIAKNMTEAMGGTIWLESAEDKGSTCFVSFPVQKSNA